MLKVRNGPPRLRKPTDEELLMERRVIAAQLIACRIVSGVSAKEIAKRMGYLHYKHLPFYARWWRGATQWYWVPRKVRKLEEELPDARFSTLQRYGRAAGLRIDATLVKPRRQTLQARAFQIKRKLRLRGQPPRRRMAL